MLPIDAVLPKLLAILERDSSAVLQAPTGSGKTTRVAPALLNTGWRGDRRILLLEPRRLAARTAARYMAAQLGERAGQTIGYRSRLDSRISALTRIEVVTEGVLTRIIQSDPELSDYAAIIFDEFHERSVQADLGLALARDVQQALREDLRLIVMSATLDSAPLAALLGNCRVIEAEGRSFPVELRYRPDQRRRSPEAHAAAVVLEALDQETGSVLVFMPGMAEIRRLSERLQDRLPETVRLCPLHGQLDAAAQDAAIQPAAPGQRKVVLASAIAESSLTIEGIRVVIDGGAQRRARFDPNSGMTRLITERVSKASAQQRRGRAGRLEPGVCYRLWSESEQRHLEAQTRPEILSADLAAPVLELAHWGLTDPADLSWLDPPPQAAWDQASALLKRLGAVDEAGHITAHGRAMLELGSHPRLAHMVLVGRQLGVARTAAELAALLGERDPGHRESVDIGQRLDALRRRPRHGLAARLFKAADRLAGDRHDQAEVDDAIGRLLARAWPDRIGHARSRRGQFLLSNGRGAFVNEADPLAGADWLVACELDGQAREARIFRAAAVELSSLESDLADQISQLEQIEWDEQRGQVTVRRQRRLGALVLDEVELDRPEPAVLEQGLLKAVRRKGVAALPWNDASRQLQARITLLHRLWPDDWPALDDHSLDHSLDSWLPPWLSGCRRWADVERLDLSAILLAGIGQQRRSELDRLAPARLQLPTGRSARIDYRHASGPVLAVKLQAMFSCKVTPTLAGGRLPVTLHLLSPAGRPLAVTADLASFWQNAYPEVRKATRGRYPKHPWPEDPIAARPTEQTTRRSLGGPSQA